MAIRLHRNHRGLRRSRERTELFDTAQAYAVGFAQSTVNGSRLGNSHFGTANQGRNVRRIGIAVTYETVLAAGLVDCCLEHPSFDPYITKLPFDSSSDPGAAVAMSHTEQARVRDVPSPIEKLEMASCNGQSIHLSQLS